jgi:predicted transcriptional regulator
VFENLPGTYNPETKETARKQSGSFYTPREIVNYMVDESLIAYLKQAVGEQYEDVFRKLFAEKPDIEVALKKQIYEALRNGKILDPACGSGAFPMGILNRIIYMMENLDYSHSIFELKLHLIENCIYGVDIQSIALQISKLRFFISLICEQTPYKYAADNFGVKPLPNLETKFVAANTLIGLSKKKEGDFTADLFEDPQIEVTKQWW